MNMNTKYEQNPVNSNEFVIVDEKRNVYARVSKHDFNTDQEAENYARTIAAAHNLLTACYAAFEQLNGTHVGGQLAEVIKKATK